MPSNSGSEATMKVKIHVELITDWDESTTVQACEFVRPMKECGTETVGLSLDDGKRLLQTLQQHVVAAQVRKMGEFFRICPTCSERQRLKGYRVRHLDTVFGTVRFRSPRLAACDCKPPFFLEVNYRPCEMSYGRAAAMLQRSIAVEIGLPTR